MPSSLHNPVRRRLCVPFPFVESTGSYSRVSIACGLALQVDVRLAADVDGDALDRAAGEAPGRVARVVVGHRLAAVAPDAQALAGDRELARLGLDAALADLRGRRGTATGSRWRRAGGSSPSLSNEADRIRSSPVGRSSVASTFCSNMPTKL